MAFIWSTDPNYPAEVPAPVIGPDKISYDQHVVANTVNVSGLVLGTLSYNTANEGFDVIYELPSLNVRNLRAQTLTAVRATINTAYINTASINTATINTANISNATISNGMMGVHPVQNLQIATKEYVDTLVANSIPLGGNLQLLIIAAGDLLVGVSDNTAERLPVGTNNGSVLTVGGAGNTGLRWTTGAIGSTSRHQGLYIGTDFEASQRNNRVQLVSVDEITMDDGVRVASGWNGLTANIRSNVATSGVGFLDTGVVRAQTCYEIWAIRNSSNGAQGLILHRSVERFVDVNHRPTTTVERRLNFAHGVGSLTCINVAQSFIATNTGPLTGIDLALTSFGNPVGNCWITLEDNNSAGNASGIPLATSRYLSAGRMPNVTTIGAGSGDTGRIRFPFDTTANVITGNIYHVVCHVDYPVGDPFTNPKYVAVWGTGGNTYASGIAKSFSANTNTWQIASITSPVGPADLFFRTYVESFKTDVLMPTGYDQKTLLSYTSTSGSLGSTPSIILGEYKQRGNKMSMNFVNHWDINYNGLSGGGDPETFMIARVQALDLRHYVPPVPCFVTFAIINPAAAAFHTCVGGIDSTDMGGPPSGPHVTEAKNSISANIASGTLMMMGPILAEHQTILMRITSLTITPYVGEVEF